MALRLYLTASAAPYTPTTIRGTWDNAGATGASHLGPRPAGTAATAAIAVGSITANWDVVLRRFVSDPVVTAGTISGTAAWILGVLESNAAANAFVHLHLYVTVGDSDTVRGTLLSDYVDTGTEWTSTGTGRGVGAQAVTSVAVQTGDRIVAVVGYRASADTTGRTATLHYGNAGAADLAQGGTGVTTAPGYVELSGADGLFYPLTSSLASTFASTPAFFSGNYGSIPPAVSGGRLQVSSDGAVLDDFAGAVTDNTTIGLQFDSVLVEVPTLPVNTGATTYSYASMQVIDSDNATDGTLAGITLNTKANTATFYIYSNYSDSAGGATSLTLDTTNHRWIRMRRSGASLLWDTSPDGQTWTNRRTVAAPASWVNYCRADLLLECYKDGGGVGLAEFDNLNTTSLDATPAPGVVAAVSAVPAPSVSTSVTVAAPVVAAVVAAPAPTLSAGATASPSAVAAAGVVPAPAVSTTTAATVNAPVVAAAVSVPVASPGTGSAATPSPVAAVVAVNAPVVSGGANVAPASVSAAVAIPAPPLRTGSTASPLNVAAPVAVPTGLVGTVTSVAPSTVAVAAAIAAPVPSAGSTPTPDASAVTVAIPAVSVTTGADANVAAPVVHAAAAVPPPPLATSTQAAPSPVTATAAVPLPAGSAGSTVNAVRVASVVAVPAAIVSAGATATPAPVAALVSVPAPVVSGRATAAPAVVAAVAAVLAPVLASTSQVAAQTVALTVAFPQVRVRRTTGGSFATTTESGSFVSSTSAGRFT